MPWSPLQRELFEWSCFHATRLADAILRRDGDEAQQTPPLRDVYRLRVEREPAFRERMELERQNDVATKVLDFGWNSVHVREWWEAVKKHEAQRRARKVRGATNALARTTKDDPTDSQTRLEPQEF